MIDEDWPFTATPATWFAIQPRPRLMTSANITVTSGIHRKSGLR